MPEEKIKISPGDTVTIDGLPGKYQVGEGPNKRGEYYLLRGAIGIWTKAEKIRRSSAEFPAMRSQKSIRRARQNRGAAAEEQKRERIDLHAMTVAEAMVQLEARMSQSLIAGANLLEIVHGFGSGKIRTAVHRYLEGSKHVRRFEIDPANGGVTLVFLG